VSPEASSLVAIVVAVGAALVACAAAGSLLLAARVARGAAGARDGLARATVALRREGPSLRDRMAATTRRLDLLRVRWVATDQAMAGLTASLGSVRGSLERVTQGRLATVIRGAGIVSKVAQFALLWR
jgi:hypothetical protein